METYLKDVPTQDIYYLTSKPNIEKRQFGWNCMDDPKNITWKYIYFIYNMNIPQYDWYIFIDDDTFVFQNRLENLLQQYNHSDYYYIGKELDHIKNICLAVLDMLFQMLYIPSYMNMFIKMVLIIVINIGVTIYVLDYGYAK
jgi:hypothetical protein